MKSSTIITVAALCFLTQIKASTVNLISNGDFESGNLNGWTDVIRSGGDLDGSCDFGFAAQTAAFGCTAGIAPVHGQYAAYLSSSFPLLQLGIGYYDNFLEQSFTVPTETISSAELDWSDSAAINGSLASDGVFLGAFVFAPGNPNPIAMQEPINNPSPSGSYTYPWQNNVLDLTSLLNSWQGQTLTLELYVSTLTQVQGTKIDQGSPRISAGFDNVSLNVTTSGSSGSPTPEPSTALIAGAALTALITAIERCQRRARKPANE